MREDLALRLGYALAAALLVEHAAGADDEAATVLATLWTLRYLAQADISDESHRYFDVLAAWCRVILLTLSNVGH